MISFHFPLPDAGKNRPVLDLSLPMKDTQIEANLLLYFGPHRRWPLTRAHSTGFSGNFDNIRAAWVLGMVRPVAGTGWQTV